MKTDLMTRKALVFFYDLRKKRALMKKVRKIISSSGRSFSPANPTESTVKEYRALWKPFSWRANTSWLKLYGSISGVWDYRYVPEDIYYNHLEPCLNDKDFSKSYADKNQYPMILGGFRIPETIACNREGVYYLNSDKPVPIAKVFERLGEEKTFILKPAVDSGGGRRVTLWGKRDNLFISNEGEKLSESYLESVYKRNYLFQKVIEQHPFFAGYNHTSLNTLRVLTYRSVRDESIHILHSVMRVGTTGSITDNQASGGFACGLTDEGKLTGMAVDKMGKKYSKVNNTELVCGTHVEGYESIVRTAGEIASRYYYSRLLGLDLCLDRGGEVIVIEVNNVNNEINFFQMLSGPLFGKFTEEVAKWCSEHERSFVIDYQI